MAHRVYLGDQGGRSYTLPDKCLPANFNPATAYQSEFTRKYIGDQTSNVIRQMLGDAGAYFIGQLEALDQRMAMPITAVTYSRDIVRPNTAADPLKNLLDSKISRTTYTDVLFTEKPLFSEDQVPDLRVDRSDKHDFSFAMV